MDIAAFCKRADWLNRERVRGYAVILALVSLVLLVVSYLDAMGAEGTDFLAFWGGGHMAAAGDPALAYDLATQERVQTATGSEGWFAFVNPPPFLFIAAPFGALPFPLAWALWVGATFALWACFAIRAFPRMWLLVLAWPGALIAAGHAQTGLLTGALLVGAAALLDRRPVASGMLIGALIIKPHLALLLPFWLAAGGRWKAFIAAGATAIGLLLASWAAFGTETMLAYTTSWKASAALMAGDDPDFYLRMATPYSQMRLIMPAEAALGVSVAIALGLIALVLVSWRRFGPDPLASGSLVLAASALASPYLFNYDLPFLIVPTLWLVREGLRQGFRDWEKAALVMLYLAPYATRTLALPLGVNLMPLASMGLMWLVWTRGQSDLSASSGMNGGQPGHPARVQ